MISIIVAYANGRVIGKNGEWDRQSFVLASAQTGVLNEQNTLRHTFFVYERMKRLHL